MCVWSLPALPWAWVPTLPILPPQEEVPGRGLSETQDCWGL